MRAFLAGWRCLYEPSSVVWHRDGHSFRKRAHAGFYFSERNRIWFIYKYFPPTLFLSGLPSLLLWELRMIKTIAITSRTPATYLRARRDGLGGIGMFRHERKRNIRALGNRLPLYRRILNHKIIGLPDPVS
jgi:GT2 family glycosyltransferase